MKHLIVLLAACAGLVAACTSGGANGSGQVNGVSSAARSSTPPGSLAFSHCMRSHRVSRFPDPDSSGVLPKVSPQQFGVSSTAFQAAQQACAYLLQPSDAQAQQTLSGMREFARCMRSHGMRNWPDPTSDSTGQPVFDLHGRIAPDSRQVVLVSDICAHLLHSAPGQNGTVLCNGIGEAGCHHYG
jgi:hypothetical protein